MTDDMSNTIPVPPASRIARALPSARASRAGGRLRQQIPAIVVTAACALPLGACSKSARPPSASPAQPRQTPAVAAAKAAPTDIAALFTRELGAIPALVAVSGRGWSTQVPGRNATVKPGTVENSEEIAFDFDGSSPIECIVFSEAFDPATYVANVVQELRKALDVVGFTPTRFTVEGEIPAYFASVLYHKKTPEGLLAGQLKLGLGLHSSRPVVCMHDVPGYTASFETAARAVFANYRIADDDPALAVTIGVARVGTMPIGFSYESARRLDNGRLQFSTISSQIVPRSATELMVSDEAEVIVISQSKVVEAHYVHGDARGEQLDVTLREGAGGKYKVSGTVGSKPIEASMTAKKGLPSPEATSLRLKQEMKRDKAFRFSQPEYHPALDPTGLIDVSYSRTPTEASGLVHVGLGRLDLLATVDEQGEQLKTEMKAGSQTIVFERMYHRDDRQNPKSQ